MEDKILPKITTHTKNIIAEQNSKYSYEVWSVISRIANLKCRNRYSTVRMATKNEYFIQWNSFVVEGTNKLLVTSLKIQTVSNTSLLLSPKGFFWRSKKYKKCYQARWGRVWRERVCSQSPCIIDHNRILLNTHKS